MGVQSKSPVLYFQKEEDRAEILISDVYHRSASIKLHAVIHTQMSIVFAV